MRAAPALWALAAFAYGTTATEGRAARTLEPSVIDPKGFLGQVAKEPGDLLVLLYSPTCPDCQWFLSRWVKITEKLQRVPSIATWTVADPDFLAPKPFEHWHNPAIFFAPAGPGQKPALLSEKVFGAYLQGNTSISQDEQDDEFVTTLVDWVGRKAKLPQVVYPVTLEAAVTAQKHLEKLAAREWNMLTQRWADTTKYGVAAEPGDAPAEQATHMAQVVPVSTPLAQAALPAGVRPGPRPRGPCHHSCTRPDWAKKPLEALRLRAAQVSKARVHSAAPAGGAAAAAAPRRAFALVPGLPVIQAPKDRGPPPIIALQA